MRILVIEDEAGIAEFVERALRGQGHDVEVAADGVTGQERALDGSADLVILDRLLPGRDGMEVLANIRATAPSLPVILLTALGDVRDRVAGLDAGATDYMTKPFSVEELLARVRAHLRTSAPQAGTRLAAAGIELDLLARTVRRDGREIALSRKEFDLLAELVRHAGRALTKAELLLRVWGYDFDPQTNVLEVYVGYLRRKLAIGGEPAPIETVRSVGYRLAVA